MKKLFSMILAAATMVACGTTNKMVINGDLSMLDRAAADSKVELRISGTEETLATTTLDANKCFTAEVTLPADDFVLVIVNDTPLLELITDGQDISFNYDAETQNVNVEGTPYNTILRDIKNEFYTMMDALYTCQSEEEAEAKFAEIGAFIEAKFVENKDNLAGLNLLQYVVYYGNADRLSEYFAMVNPEFAHTALYKEFAKQVANAKNTAIGADLVDIALADAEGNIIKVSELCNAGKWVLVDFWATWCGPCRGEIPHLVEAYAEFAPKGLEIYGITFDRNGDTEKWQNFVKENNMTWVNVWGTDEKGGWSAGEAYNVSSIPSNFLFSPEGKLVAKNLRGEEVKKVLSEHIQ
ncbi:MAG: TlpA family protein disulfide reductase [Alistipes sp.]|nr:TlpA family protein disulfide reductase [Alistipes sp.]